MMLTLLAQGTNSPTGPEFGKASPLGLVIVLVLLAGTILLIRNMNRHIKNLPAEFSPEHPEADQEADEGTEHGIAASEDHEAAQAEDTESEPRSETKPEATNGTA
ncbi:hypothetical protein [Nocardia sp. NPDC059228]|uniref:hypothetical protein n=1 Tax=Nocardia sp. NPDC059228 TaxID=3346777 RepID=UPI0036C632AB